MKKIGIVTLHGYFNYGNRLQNYASQEVLRSLGCDPITIIPSRIENLNIKTRKSFLNKLKRFSFKKLGKYIKLLFIRIRKNIYLTRKEKNNIVFIEKRAQKFKLFTQNNINETDYLIDKMEIPTDFHESFDYFIVGSDQVWNRNPFSKNSLLYFLTFAPKSKRISYAASFGVSEILAERKEKFTEYLSDFNHISVREEDGAKIVKELTGRDVDVLVDPTLILTKEEWLKISKPSPNKPKKQYILVYFLGELPKETKQFIDNITKEFNFEIVRLEEGSGNVIDKANFTTDPSEFIDYVSSASLVLTDSFHGTVFSILSEKPFVVFKRGNMNSRLDTLLSKFEFEERKYSIIKTSTNIMDIDYSHVPEILEYERTKALDFLKNALEI